MGTLYLVATPIGNLEDITIRAIKTLFSVDYIACEDTRKTGQLLKNLHCHAELVSASPTRSRNKFGMTGNSKPKLISYYDEIEFKRVPEIVEILKSEKSVALVSNAGTPLISDPGFKLVKECLRRDIKVVSIPGPSAVISALVSSGFPCNQFLFLGYLPKNKSKRKKLLKDLLQCCQTLEHIKPITIFFETARRLNKSLVDLKEIFGDIEIVIARELTKIHEEIIRGKISDCLKQVKNIKGELVLLFPYKT